MLEEHGPLARRPQFRGPFGMFMRAIEVVEAAVGVLILLGIVVLVMVQVIVRFTSFGGWAWTGEFARFGLMWLTFVMAGYLMSRDEHIALDIVDHVLSERGRRVVLIFSHLAVAAICIAFAYEGVGLIDAQRGITSTAAQIPMSLVYSIPTVGFAFTALQALVAPFATKVST